MKLLTADEVKTEKTRSDEERALRIQKLEKEESDLTARVNEKRTNIGKEIALLDSQLIERQSLIAKRKLELDAEISALSREVKQLEDRRSEALKPIDEIRQEAEKLLESANRAQADVEADKAELQEGWDHLAVLMEDVTDRETSNVEKSDELDQRERRVAESEARTKESAEKVSQEWLKFHKEVHGANESLARREKGVADRAKANNEFAASLSNKETELMAREIRLKDQYETLARSKKEIETGDREVEKIK